MELYLSRSECIAERVQISYEVFFIRSFNDFNASLQAKYLSETTGMSIKTTQNVPQ